MKANLFAASLVTSIALVGMTTVPAFADDGGNRGAQSHWNWMYRTNGAQGNGWGSTPPQTVTGSVYGNTPATITLSVGWNLVDSSVAMAMHATVTDFWNGSAYQSRTQNLGNGIWVYESVAKTVDLPLSLMSDYTVQAGVGTWTMIGNPFPTSETVTLHTGDAGYTYDPASNQYSATQTGTLTLQPGQGAWLYSTSGGTYTIGMTPPAPPSASPS